MLLRFSLYGFLKNQRYFEPFLVLALLDKGLDFLAIGVLVAFREIAVNVMEIPSGAIADLWGRRRAMILSFVAYIASFAVIAWADAMPLLFLGFALFAMGESFRTGTHKAMIFTWLALHGRIDERVAVYGYTRSWSKLGSAVSVIIATTLVMVSDNYTAIFLFSTVPYALNIVNFIGYPRALEGEATGRGTPRHLARHLWQALSAPLRQVKLRGLVAESMAFEGVFHAAKDYLQPLLVATAATIATVDSSLSDVRRSALLIGPVYLLLFLLSAFASRQAHRVVTRFGGEESAAHRMWCVALAIYLACWVAGYADFRPALVAGFVALNVLQNVWRPILISRFDSHGNAEHGATLLSIESQSRRLATVVVAPLLGWAVDTVLERGIGGAFWPIGAAGALATVPFVLAARRGKGIPQRML